VQEQVSYGLRRMGWGGGAPDCGGHPGVSGSFCLRWNLRVGKLHPARSLGR